MASKDIKSLSLSRSSVKSVLMSESVLAVQLFKHESLVKQLSVLEFFVHAFSLAGDVEATSCLVMRYEALVLRELKSATCPWAQVTPDEWLTFVVQSLVSGFFSNAVKGCDYALSCLKKKDDENTSVVEKVVDNVEITRKVKKLRDMAISSASSCSFQAQAADYLRKKTQNNNNRKRQLPQHHTETQPLASDLFQNAIKKRHVRPLRWSQQKGHIVTKKMLPPRPSDRKGKTSKRVHFVRSLIREVAPYRKRGSLSFSKQAKTNVL
ncbi:unnamed protein product [Rhodiola kirilowii]